MACTSAFRGSLRLPRRALLGGLAMPFVSIPGRAWAAEQLVVASYGGGWAAAMTEAFHKPFTQETGIQVVVASGTDLAKAKAQVMTKNIQWDVVAKRLETIAHQEKK